MDIATPALAEVLPTPRARAIAREQAVRCGSFGLIVALGEATELLEPTPPALLPGSPGWLRGLANLHGNVVPVVDVADRAAAPAGPGSKPMWLVVGKDDAAVALTIDGMPTRWDPADATPSPAAAAPAVLGAAVRAAFGKQGITWYDVDFPALFEQLTATLRAPAAATPREKDSLT